MLKRKVKVIVTMYAEMSVNCMRLPEMKIIQINALSNKSVINLYDNIKTNTKTKETVNNLSTFRELYDYILRLLKQNNMYVQKYELANSHYFDIYFLNVNIPNDGYKQILY